MKAAIRFQSHTAVALVLSALAFSAQPAWAQAAVSPDQSTNAPPSTAPALPETAQTEGTAADDEIVVTGTSLRGVAPVGANLISVTAEALESTGAQTVSDALRTVPALSNAGATGQGPTVAFYQPSIHNLGASASNSTLVLIDGHRAPTGGTNHTFLDPNIIPPQMLERVEVLPEGSSSIYGSDAVAGVVNFITRKRFDGLRATGQYTFGKGTHGYSAGMLAGKTWSDGSAVFAYNYSQQGNLPNNERSFTYPDQRARGGTNFLGFNCSPATIQMTGQSTIYTSPTSGTAVANTAANGLCTSWGYGDLIGSEKRHTVMGKISQDLTDRLTVGLDMVYGRRRNDTLGGAGTIQATVFETGAQANPFYVRPTGYTGTATSQQIRWDATELLGPAHNYTTSDTMYAAFTASYKLGSDWNADFLATAGRDESASFSEGAMNGSVATLALNGTTNGGGSTTATSIPGTSVVITQLPLTAANALDVWNPAATNRTSAATIEALRDNLNLLRNTSGYQQFRLSVGGSLFALPAGNVKLAVGGEFYNTQLSQFVTRANNAGRASAVSQQLQFKFDRKVKSAFAELNIPVISDEMNVPLVRKFDVSLAGRHDDYDDVGKTTNPKVAFGWDVDSNLHLRGNYSTSFVAPPLTTIGDQYGAFGTAGWNSVTNNLEVPVSAYSNLPQLGIPGCTSTSVTCNISGLQGVQVTKGDPSKIGPQDGKGWALGLDFTPTFIPRLRISGTFWYTKFTGGVTGPNIQNAVNTSSANFLLNFYPGGATAAQLAAVTQGIPQRSTAPALISYIFQSLNSNYLNLTINGLDYAINYSVPTQSAGTFFLGVNGTQFTRYTQSFGSGPTYNILDTTGNNTTFPSIGTQIRGNVGWQLGGFKADMFANYTGPYTNWGGTSVTPITRATNGTPNGGGDRVKSNLTVDFDLTYKLPADGFLGGSQIALTGRNLFNRVPPFYNGSTGYDGLAGNPFGRSISLSLKVDLF